MSMSPRDWLDMASVYQAGTDQQRGYTSNVERQQQADALEAMAERCVTLAVQRNMTLDDLESVHYAERQARVPRGSRVQCRVFILADNDGGAALCTLHRDHVQDGTSHVKPDS